MKIYFSGQKVPYKVQKVTITGYRKGDPYLRFSSPCILKQTKTGYYIRPIVLIIGVLSVLALKGVLS
jgi:hypothetical protein